MSVGNSSQDERLRERLKPLEELLAKGIIDQQQFEAGKNKIILEEQVVFCANCGSSNLSAARFCFKCGAKLEDVGAAPVAVQDKTEISKTFGRAKAVRKIGMHTIEAEWSNWTSRIKIRVDGQELLSKFKFTASPEVIAVGDKKFIVKAPTLGKTITIEELTSESQRFADFVGKWKGFLKEPSKAFEASVGDTLKVALEYYARLAFIYSVILVLLVFLGVTVIITKTGMPTVLRTSPLPTTVLFPILTWASIIAFYILMIAGAFIGGTILHIFVYIIGGRKGVSQTIKAVMYGSTPGLLLGWIPILGIFAWIWALILQIRGLRVLQGLTTGRATAGVFAFIFISFLGAAALVTQIQVPTITPPVGETGLSTGNVFSIAVVKGSVQDATINIYELNNDGTRGRLLIGPIKSDTFGNLDLTLPAELPYRLLVEARGGTYTDEVNRATVQLTNDDVMLTVLPAGIRRAAVTPFTHMAATLAMEWMRRGTAPDVAVTQANILVAQQYQLQSILEVVPAIGGDQNTLRLAEQHERAYGALLAGLAQLAKNLNVRTIDLTDALARDWSDGTVDGLQFGAPITLNDISRRPVTLTANTGLNDLQASTNAFLTGPNNPTGLKEMYISVNPLQGSPDFAITTTALPYWESGRFGAFTLTAGGGKPPYIWALQPGSALPEGFALSRDGVISGTSTLPPGTTKRISPPFIVTVTDSSARPNVQQIILRITVVQPAPELILKPVECVVNEKCHLQVAWATGGTPPYYFKSDTFRLGAPPFGMIVDLNGFLTGRPSREGRYNFGVCVVDLVGASSCGGTEVTVTKSETSTPTPTTEREESVNLTIRWSGTGSGTMWSNPLPKSTLACTSTTGESYYQCIDVHPRGTTVTLTTKPESGSTFKGWSGACSGTGPCVVTVDADKTVTMRFDLITPIPSPSPSPAERPETWTGTGTLTVAYEGRTQNVCYGKEATVTYTLTLNSPVSLVSALRGEKEITLWSTPNRDDTSGTIRGTVAVVRQPPKVRADYYCELVGGSSPDYPLVFAAMDGGDPHFSITYRTTLGSVPGFGKEVTHSGPDVSDRELAFFPTTWSVTSISDSAIYGTMKSGFDSGTFTLTKQQ